MANYYLDIETTGLDPETCDIITLQYASMDGWTGRLSGDVHVLTEWNCDGEKGMLERFAAETEFMHEDVFEFIPVGYCLSFEEKFLRAKMDKHGICGRYGFDKVDIIGRPHVDLHSVGILCNGGAFRGSGLANMTAKQGNGSGIPELYANGDHAAIMEYVRNEARAFVDWYVWLLKRMPEMHREWKGTLQ